MALLRSSGDAAGNPAGTTAAEAAPGAAPAAALVSSLGATTTDAFDSVEAEDMLLEMCLTDGDGHGSTGHGGDVSGRGGRRAMAPRREHSRSDHHLRDCSSMFRFDEASLTAGAALRVRACVCVCVCAFARARARVLVFVCIQD